MSTSRNELIERAYEYGRRPKKQYRAAELTETDEWYEIIHRHFEDVLLPEIVRRGELFIEYWPVRFISDREYTLRQGIASDTIYNYEYGAHGTGLICVSNGHVDLVVLKRLTDKFPIKKPSLTGFLLDVLSKQITQLRPFQNDYSWTLAPVDIQSISVYSGQGGPERIKMVTSSGVWEIFDHFNDHGEEIRLGLECLRNGTFSKLRPKWHFTRRPPILSEAQMKQNQSKTDLALAVLPDNLDSKRSENGLQMLDLHYLAGQVVERGGAEVGLDLAHAIAAHPNIGELRELNRTFVATKHFIEKCSNQDEILDNLHIRIDRIPELAIAYQDSVGGLARPHFKSWHSLPDMPTPAFIKTIEIGEIHNPEGHTSRLSFCWGPKGSTLITGGNDGIVRIWDLSTGEVQMQFQAFEKRANHYSHNIVSCILSPDGNTLVTVSLGQGIKCWNTDDWQIRFYVDLDGQLQHCEFGADGKYISYSKYSSNAVTVLDASSGWPLQHKVSFESLKLEDDRALRSFRLSPSGSWVLLHIEEDGDGFVHRFVAVDLFSGEELFAFAGFDVHHFSISPNGNYIVMLRGPYEDLDVWDVAKGDWTHSIKRPSHGSYSFSSSGKYVVSGFTDGRITIYLAESGEAIYSLIGHLESTGNCQFSSDEAFLLSMDGRNCINLWDLAKASLPFSTPKYFLSTNSINDARRARSCTRCDVSSLDDTVLVVNSVDHDAAILDSLTGAISKNHSKTSSWQTHLHEEKLSQIQYFGVSCCDFSNDGRRVLLANGDGWAIFDTRNMNVLVSQNLGHLPDYPRACALSADNQWAAIVSRNDLMIWNLTTEQSRTVEAGSLIQSIVFDPDSHWIAYTSGSITGKSEFKMVDLDAKTARHFDNPVVSSKWRTEGNRAFNEWGFAYACTVTPDGTQIIAAHAYGMVSVWHTADLTLTNSWQAHNVHSPGVSIACKSMPDGKTVITVGSDGAVRLWEIQSGKCLTSFFTEGKLSDCAIFPDGRRVIAVGEAGVFWLEVNGN